MFLFDNKLSKDGSVVIVAFPLRLFPKFLFHGLTR